MFIDFANLKKNGFLKTMQTVAVSFLRRDVNRSFDIKIVATNSIYNRASDSITRASVTILTTQIAIERSNKLLWETPV